MNYVSLSKMCNIFYKFAKIDYESLLEWITETDPGHNSKFNINALKISLLRIEKQLLTLLNLVENQENFYQFIDEEINYLQVEVKNFVTAFEVILNFLLYAGPTISYQENEEILSYLSTVYPKLNYDFFHNKKVIPKNILKSLSDAEIIVNQLLSFLKNLQSYPQENINFLTEKRIQQQTEDLPEEDYRYDIFGSSMDVNLLEKILDNFDVWIKFCDMASELFKTLKISKLSTMFDQYTQMISDQKDFLKKEFMPIYQEYLDSEIRERLDKPNADPQILKEEDPEYYQELEGKDYDPTLTDEDLEAYQATEYK